MRQSILEGLNFSRQNHPLPFPPPPALPFYPASVYPRHFGPVPPSQGRGRGFAGELYFGNLSSGEERVVLLVAAQLAMWRHAIAGFRKPYHITVILPREGQETEILKETVRKDMESPESQLRHLTTTSPGWLGGLSRCPIE